MGDETPGHNQGGFHGQYPLSPYQGYHSAPRLLVQHPLSKGMFDHSMLPAFPG